MADLAKLRELQERASPGPWRWRTYQDKEWDGEDDEFLTFGQLRAANGDEVASGVWRNDSTADIGVHNAATAKLLSLAPHLLPISKALEGLAVAKNHGFGCWARADEPDIRCEVEDGLDALKALQEALDA